MAAFYGKTNADVNKAVRSLIADLQDTDNQRGFFTPNEINDLTGTSIADYDSVPHRPNRHLDNSTAALDSVRTDAIF